MKKTNYEPVKDPAEFKQTVEIANSCAEEYLLTDNPNLVDCYFCPCRKDCTEFWDTHIVNCDVVEEITQKFRKFHKRKASVLTKNRGVS